MQAENTANLDNFKWRLSQAADAAGLTQAEIATRLNVKPQRVGNWFQGRNFPRQREAIALAKLLLTSTEWLLQGTDNETSHSVVEDQAAYGSISTIEEEIRNHVEGLLTRADGNRDRLGWISEQLRLHLTPPAHWRKSRSSPVGYVLEHGSLPSHTKKLSSKTGLPLPDDGPADEHAAQA